VRMIEEEGAQAVIMSILGKFDAKSARILAAKPYVQLAESNPRVALSRLLNDVRQLPQQTMGEKKKKC
jgi:hypothetical protein